MYPLDLLGYSPFFSTQLELLGRSELRAARIVADGRDPFPLAGSKSPFGELSGKLRQSVLEGRGLRPVVGDWVATTESGDRAAIHHVLDRRTELRRRAAGSEVRAQVVAANVDVYFVVTAVGRDLNLRRLERYVTAVWDSNATPVVVLNKTDLGGDVNEQRCRIESVAPAVPVVAVSVHTGVGLDELRSMLPWGATAAFIGSSGVGKSSLINRLLGRDQLSTHEVSVDGRGRHTTTRAELLVVPQGFSLIDTPGLREFGLLSVSAGLDRTFADVAEHAMDCRFRNCSHQDEPGCAVREAVSQGWLPTQRLEAYRRLLREAAATEARRSPVLAGNSKRRSKAIAKAIRALDKRGDKDA